MEVALQNRLNIIGEAKTFANEFNINVDEKEIKNTKSIILNEFYKNDNLAYEVSKGETCYSNQINPILAKYDGFWRKVLAPKKDKDFDKNAEKVINSIESVVGFSVCTDNLMTEKRATEINQANKLTLLVGGFLSAFFLTVNYLLPESYQATDYVREIISTTGGGIFIPLTYFMFQQPNATATENNIKDLREAAVKADNFLYTATQNLTQD